MNAWYILSEKKLITKRRYVAVYLVTKSVSSILLIHIPSRGTLFINIRLKEANNQFIYIAKYKA